MKVQLIMQTCQTIDGEAETYTHEAGGILREMPDGRLRLTYLLDGIHHEMTISAAEKSVRVVKNWDEENVLLYKEGFCHEMLYDTPVGGLDLGFDTHAVEIRAGASRDSWNIRLQYGMLQYGKAVADCELSIAISVCR